MLRVIGQGQKHQVERAVFQQRQQPRGLVLGQIELQLGIGLRHVGQGLFLAYCHHHRACRVALQAAREGGLRCLARTLECLGECEQ